MRSFRFIATVLIILYILPFILPREYCWGQEDDPQNLPAESSYILGDSSASVGVGTSNDTSHIPGKKAGSPALVDSDQDIKGDLFDVKNQRLNIMGIIVTLIALYVAILTFAANSDSHQIYKRRLIPVSLLFLIYAGLFLPFYWGAFMAFPLSESIRLVNICFAFVIIIFLVSLPELYSFIIRRLTGRDKACPKTYNINDDEGELLDW